MLNFSAGRIIAFHSTKSLLFVFNKVNKAGPNKKNAATKSHYNAQPEKENSADRASYRANCDARKSPLSCKFRGKEEGS